MGKAVDRLVVSLAYVKPHTATAHGKLEQIKGYTRKVCAECGNPVIMKGGTAHNFETYPNAIYPRAPHATTCDKGASKTKFFEDQLAAHDAMTESVPKGEAFEAFHKQQAEKRKELTAGLEAMKKKVGHFE